MTTVVDAAPATILDPQRHARLLADIEGIAKTANIPVTMVHQSAKPYLSAEELDWLRHFNAYREQGVAGLLMTGTPAVPVDTKLMAMVGALLRNFVDARLMPLNSVLSAAEESSMPEPTVLAIPNLFVRSVGKSLPDWKVQTVYDVLLQRLTTGKPSLLYVESMKDLQAVYGSVFHRHLTSNYKEVASV